MRMMDDRNVFIKVRMFVMPDEEYVPIEPLSYKTVKRLMHAAISRVCQYYWEVGNVINLCLRSPDA